MALDEWMHTLRYSTLHCSTVRFFALHHTTLHCIPPYVHTIIHTHASQIVRKEVVRFYVKEYVYILYTHIHIYIYIYIYPTTYDR